MTEKSKEEGTVLLTTLLVMSIMAVISIAIIEDIKFAVKKTINTDHYAQTHWYLMGAEDYIESFISNQYDELDVSIKNDTLRKSLSLSYPYDGGMISANITDGTDCFSLGSLITVEGRADVAGRRQFEYLMGSLGIPEYKSKKISYSLSDWMDADTQRELLGAEDGDYLRRPIPHRTPNSIISSVMELRSIEGIDENIYKRIRPHICVRMQGSRTKFNINTSEAKDAFLLSSILGGSDFYETALAIISERPKKGYENIQELRSSQALQNFEGDSVAYDQIVFEPSFLWVEVKVDYRNASRVVSYEYDVSDGNISKIYKGWGYESLRPKLQEKEL